MGVQENKQIIPVHLLLIHHIDHQFLALWMSVNAAWILNAPSISHAFINDLLHEFLNQYDLIWDHNQQINTVLRKLLDNNL